MRWKDSKPKCKILPSPLRKIHQLHYLILPKESGEVSELLAVSTEEGQILFFDTNSRSPIGEPERTQDDIAPAIQAIGGLGGPQEGIVGRIKDFEILNHTVNRGSVECRIVVAGSSDGTIRVWALNLTEFAIEKESPTGDSQNESSQGRIPEARSARLVGRLIGTFETGNRITCLKAFVMSDTTGREISVISNGNNEKDSNRLNDNDSQSRDD